MIHQAQAPCPCSNQKELSELDEMLIANDAIDSSLETSKGGV